MSTTPNDKIIAKISPTYQYQRSPERQAYNSIKSGYYSSRQPQIYSSPHRIHHNWLLIPIDKNRIELEKGIKLNLEQDSQNPDKLRLNPDLYGIYLNSITNYHNSFHSSEEYEEWKKMWKDNHYNTQQNEITLRHYSIDKDIHTNLNATGENADRGLNYITESCQEVNNFGTENYYGRNHGKNNDRNDNQNYIKADYQKPPISNQNFTGGSNFCDDLRRKKMYAWVDEIQAYSMNKGKIVK